MMIWAKSIRLFKLLVVTSSVGFVLGCSSGRPQNDKGGDHIPTGKVYPLAQLPKEVYESGVTPIQVDNAFLQPQVRVSSQYFACFSRATTSELDVRIANIALKTDRDFVNDSGLEVALNRTLKGIKKWFPSRSQFSSRIEIQSVLSDGNGCALFYEIVKGSSFPFNETSFKSRDWVMFSESQLMSDSGNTNKIPVIYLRHGLDTNRYMLAMNQSMAAFIGLGYSDHKNSILNSGHSRDQEELSSGLEFRLESKDGKILLERDAAIFYSFAGVYQDLLKPQDLGAMQHYLDRVSPSTAKEDSLLNLDHSIEKTEFNDVFDSRFLRGVRNLKPELSICFSGQETFQISEDWLKVYLDFADYKFEPRKDSGLFYQLHKIDSKFAVVARLSKDNCHLKVEFRSDSQYPFKEHNLAGLYAHEKTLKDRHGRLNDIPVIYINATVLHTNPQSEIPENHRYIGDVIQHEVAHFMGFSHSNSSSSILAAAGNHRSWDVNGDDRKMFEAYLRRCK